MKAQSWRRNRMLLRMIVSSVMRRRSRMLVALLAVGAGAAILSGLITLYHDVPRQFGEEFRSYGANLLLLPEAPAQAFSPDKLEQALGVIGAERTVGAAPFRYEQIRINDLGFMLAGTDFAAVARTAPFWQIHGAAPAGGDEALLGQEIATRLALKTGDSFELRGMGSASYERRFKVTGILTTGGPEEGMLYVTLKALEDLTGKAGIIQVAQCSIRAEATGLAALAEELKAQVPGLKGKVVKRLANSETQVLGRLQALVYIVTLVVLALIMLCVATTMMAVITERRREIGLRKALGASDAGIFGEFMGEALLLGGLGGVLGAGLGYAFAFYVSREVFSRSIELNVPILLVTVLLSIAVTAAASLWPVRSATGVDPALVLKGE